MSNDATLGYADRLGVRCGTSHEHTAFDPMAQELLSLRLRLLIAMEGTILSPQYPGLVIGEVFEKFESLKECCQKIEGQFVLLWITVSSFLRKIVILTLNCWSKYYY